MPTYEYVCTSCGHRVEAVQSFSDPSLTACPVCQGALRKVFGNVGIVLKGSGFYKTDSRSTARSNGSGAPQREVSKEKEPTSSGDSSTKDSSAKETASTKDAPASTPSPSSSGGSEKAAASST
jgi:putative FmdB family regulatory protein